MSAPREVWVVSSPECGPYSVLETQQEADEVLHVVKIDDATDQSIVTRYVLPDAALAAERSRVVGAEGRAALWDTFVRNACVQTDEDGGVWAALYCGDVYDPTVAGLTEAEHARVGSDHLPHDQCADAITRMVGALRDTIALLAAAGSLAAPSGTTTEE